MSHVPWPSGTAYLTLSTVSADGVPWATPVWFAPDGDGMLWVSRPTRRHSRNVAEHPSLAFTCFDSSLPPGGTAEAVYGEAVAGLVPEGDIPRAVAVYSARSTEQGREVWTVDRVTGEATLRLYRARFTALWMLDERENRVEIPLP